MPPGVSLEKLPRSICSLCSKVWDFAMIPEDSLPSHGICSDCKNEIANGFKAFICVGQPPIWMKSPALKTEQKIFRVTDKEYAQLRRKMNANFPPFNLAGMKIGDGFLGCPKCGVQFPAGAIARPICSNCNGPMRSYTVTEFDVIPKSEGGNDVPDK